MGSNSLRITALGKEPDEQNERNGDFNRDNTGTGWTKPSAFEDFFFFFTYSDPSGVGNGNPLQYSCLENSMNRGAWQATVHGHRVRHDWAFIHTSPRSQGSPWARRKSQRKGKGRLWNVSGQAAGGDIRPNNLHLKSHSAVGRCLKCQTSLPQMDSENWEECPKVPTVLYFKKIYS